MRSFLLFGLLFSAYTGQSQPLIRKQGSISQLKKNYLSVLKKFERKICRRSDKRKFEKLLKKYRSGEYYIPYLRNKQIDFKAIQGNMNTLYKKRDWLKRIDQSFEFKNKSFYLTHINKIQKKINGVLEIKKQAVINRQQPDPQLLQSKVHDVRRAYDDLKVHIPFLLNFGYPVDHLKNRLEYSNHKERSLKNATYFKRKIYEDGAYDPDHTRPDKYLRTTLDTIGTKFSQSPINFDEDLRYDLEWALGQIEYQIKRGKRKQHSRVKEWQKRTQAQINFYTKLLNGKNIKKVIQQAKTKSEAANELKDFVYFKQAQTYQFFANYKPYIQALFAFDNILLHEVGNATPENYRDRLDVAQVVINRFNTKRFSRINGRDRIFQSIKKKTSFKSATTNQYKWLNTLFKEGEFSFTYYYFPASVYTFCPDNYVAAKRTRNKNLALALHLLRNPNSEFKALKYYSRKSMVGKIKVDQLWPEAKVIAERPGRRIKNDKKLKRLFNKQNYRYFYSYKSLDNKEYHVVEMNDSLYAINNFHSKPKFFNYRNRHDFIYFQ